ncbi:MAG: MarR family transcriptional regulator [Pseudomonadota bacterium]
MDKPIVDFECQYLQNQDDESHLLRELHRTHQLLSNNLLRIVGLSGSKLALLRLLAIELPKGAGTMELARRQGINAAAVSRLVKEMEEQKWVNCRTDPTDGRRIHVSLSAKGRRQFSQAHERAHIFERSVSERLTKKDIEAAIKVLSEIRDAIEKF